MTERVTTKNIGFKTTALTGSGKQESTNQGLARFVTAGLGAAGKVAQANKQAKDRAYTKDRRDDAEIKEKNREKKEIDSLYLLGKKSEYNKHISSKEFLEADDDAKVKKINEWKEANIDNSTHEFFSELIDYDGEDVPSVHKINFDNFGYSISQDVNELQKKINLVNFNKNLENSIDGLDSKDSIDDLYDTALEINPNYKKSSIYSMISSNFADDLSNGVYNSVRTKDLEKPKFEFISSIKTSTADSVWKKINKIAKTNDYNDNMQKAIASEDLSSIATVMNTNPNSTSSKVKTFEDAKELLQTKNNELFYDIYSTGDTNSMVGVLNRSVDNGYRIKFMDDKIDDLVNGNVSDENDVKKSFVLFREATKSGYNFNDNVHTKMNIISTIYDSLPSKDASGKQIEGIVGTNLYRAIDLYKKGKNDPIKLSDSHIKKVRNSVDFDIENEVDKIAWRNAIKTVKYTGLDLKTTYEKEKDRISENSSGDITNIKSVLSPLTVGKKTYTVDEQVEVLKTEMELNGYEDIEFSYVGTSSKGGMQYMINAVDNVGNQIEYLTNGDTIEESINKTIKDNIAEDILEVKKKEKIAKKKKELRDKSGYTKELKELSTIIDKIKEDRKRKIKETEDLEDLEELNDVMNTGINGDEYLLKNVMTTGVNGVDYLKKKRENKIKNGSKLKKVATTNNIILNNEALDIRKTTLKNLLDSGYIKKDEKAVFVSNWETGEYKITTEETNSSLTVDDYLKIFGKKQGKR